MPLVAARLSTSACALRGKSVLFFTPTWPDPSGSAAGVRTLRLIKAFREWTERPVAVASAERLPQPAILESSDFVAHALPLNCSTSLATVVASTQPDICVFDRFYLEEQFSFAIREARPGALRILDMQDLHALRLRRQRTCEASGGSIRAVLTSGFPVADDSVLVRELAAVHRSDLTFACSPVEECWLRDVAGVPADKLVLAPFFVDAAEEDGSGSDSDVGSIRGLPFDEREGFVALGTFRHPPNLDSFTFLAKDVWPRVRRALPGASISIVGSHPTADAAARFHRPDDGLILRGFLPDAALADLLGRSRALLAPLRFGAGLKGKIVDAWAAATPVVTTPIGAEGMLLDPRRRRIIGGGVGGAHDGGEDATGSSMDEWGGLWTSTDAAGLAADAVSLHSDESVWRRCSGASVQLRRALYGDNGNGPLLGPLRAAVATAHRNLAERRDADFLGATLWHHRQRATEYFSRWLEAKGKASKKA